MPLIVPASKMATFDNRDTLVSGSNSNWYDLPATTTVTYVKGRTYLLFLYAQYVATTGYGSNNGKPWYMGDTAVLVTPDSLTYGGPLGGWGGDVVTSPTGGWFEISNVANSGQTRQLTVYVHQPTTTSGALGGQSIRYYDQTLLGLAGNIVEFTNCEYVTPIRTTNITYNNSSLTSNSVALASVGKQNNAMVAYGAPNIDDTTLSVESGWTATGALTTNTGQPISTQVAFRNNVLDAGRNCTFTWTTASTGAFFIAELQASRYPMVSII